MHGSIRPGSDDGRLALGMLAGVAAAGGAVVLGAGALAVALARRVLTPPSRRDEPERIVSVDLARGEIVLAASDESRMRGRYTFWFNQESGHARLGDVLDEGLTTVRRTIDAVDFGRLERARAGRFAGWWYLGPWELGHGYANVVVETPIGPAPAWHVPAAEPDGRWIVMVHGRGTRRQEALRAVDAVRAAGWDSLVVSWRNDGEAPESDDRRYGLGATEWPDVEAAVRYAHEQGARRIVLLGWSMGGAISLQTVLRSPEAAELVEGIVLDSPAVDWSDILRFQGAEIGLPPRFAGLVARVLRNRRLLGLTGAAAPIELDELDAAAHADALAVPILVLHSEDDGFVPIGGSRRLAAARPDLVELHVWDGARHTKLWNRDPARWEREVVEWLRALPVQPASASRSPS